MEAQMEDQRRQIAEQVREGLKGFAMGRAGWRMLKEWLRERERERERERKRAHHSYTGPAFETGS